MNINEKIILFLKKYIENMTFHLIDPKASIKSANSAQKHYNTSSTACVYFSGLNYPSCVVHVCTIISVSLTTHKFYNKQPLVQETGIIYKMPKWH